MDKQGLYALSKRMLFFILTVLFLVHPVLCGRIIDVPSKSGMLNDSLSVTCSYVLEDSENFDFIYWDRKRTDTDYVGIVRIKGASENNYYQAGIDLEGRSDLTLSNNIATINIRRLECGDEALYKCRLTYFDTSGTIAEVSNAMSDQLVVKGRPEKPSSLIQQQAEVAEFDTITFVCIGIVGKSPTGSIKWEGVEGNEVKSLTSADDATSETPGSCTQTVKSTLVLNVSRSDNKMVVRCRTTHPLITSENLYLESKPLVVFYPIDEEGLSVYQSPNKPTQEEGKHVFLKCNMLTVPAATYKWIHIQTNTTFDAGSSGQKEFDSIQLSDIGTYRCVAVNSYLNLTFTASKTLLVEVQKPTTPASTITPGVSPTTPDGGVTQGSTDPGEDKTTVIIIVVCVVVIVIIAAVIILFIIYRRKRNNKAEKIEVPSEKPYNNNPAINSFTTQPDLVNDEKKKYQNPYQNYSGTNDYQNHNNSFDVKSVDLSYGELNFDDRPRSRKPMALSDADYADISMPHV